MARRSLRVAVAVAVALRGAVASAPGSAAAKPHVVIMLADDLGFNDISAHGSSQIPTPAIDALMERGARLDQYYVQPVCSPTRATLLTGRHVIHTGVYDPVLSGSRGDLSLNFTLLPQRLAALGYSTHMVGKWHLGDSSWRFTPLARGFSTYMGYLSGAEDYWKHGDADSCKAGNCLDFWNGTSPDYSETCDYSSSAGYRVYDPRGELKESFSGKPWNPPRGNDCAIERYSAHVFVRRASHVIDTVASSGAPLFLYLAWQSVHSPDQAPQHYIDSFESTIANQHRRTFAAMVRALDEGVANVTARLELRGMLNDTLIVFSTDNGGPADNFNSNMACNWPLRGTKRTLFEGGVRGVGFIAGAGVTKKGTVRTDKVFVGDFFLSILTAVAQGIRTDLRTGERVSHDPSRSWRDIILPGMEAMPLLPGDGMDLWGYLSGQHTTSPRTEILHEAHSPGNRDGNGNALRVGDWKIVLRTGSMWARGTAIGSNDGWFGGPGSSDANTSGYSLPVGASSQPWTVQCKPPPASFTAGYACEGPTGSEKRDAMEYACLFNVKQDPCEQVDLSKREGLRLRQMWERLNFYRQTAVGFDDAVRSPDGPNCPLQNATCTLGPGCHGMSGTFTPCGKKPPL